MQLQQRFCGALLALVRVKLWRATGSPTARASRKDVVNSSWITRVFRDTVLWNGAYHRGRYSLAWWPILRSFLGPDPFYVPQSDALHPAARVPELGPFSTSLLQTSTAPPALLPTPASMVFTSL
jgi:hypothetical protein